MKTIEMMAATSSSKSHMDNTIRIADRLRDDPESDERISRQQCRACYYIPRMSGSRALQSSCWICNSLVSNASTDIDRLCVKCAKKHKLCRHCGGDLALNLNRRKWTGINREDEENEQA